MPCPWLDGNVQNHQDIHDEIVTELKQHKKVTKYAYTIFGMTTLLINPSLIGRTLVHSQMTQIGRKSIRLTSNVP